MKKQTMTKWGVFIVMATLFCSCNKYSSIFTGGGETGEEFEEIIDKKNKMLSLVVHSGNDIVKEQLWEDGSSIGLFLTKDTLHNVYEDNELYSNVKAVYHNGIWRMTPEIIELTDNPAIIYAYAPYNRDIDPMKMKVECESGEVYMYGTHGKEQEYVRRGEAKAFLNMYKTQCLIDFRIKKDKLEGNLLLKGIKIRRKGSNSLLPIEGIVNIQSGEMTYTNYGTLERTGLAKVIKEEFTPEARVLIPVLPYQFDDNEVEIIFNVNGRERSITLGGEQDWVAGKRNIINLTFSGEDIFVDVAIKKWDTLENRLIIYYT